jgi:F-type H+-transporting ATPase subunit epsilon
MPFHATVVTPEQQAFDAQVRQAILPAHDGLIGILTGRAPLLVRIGVGPLRLDLANGSSQFFLIDGGVAQMKDDNLTIVTGDATPASEIDYEAATALHAEATARPAVDQGAFENRQRMLAKARAMKEMAGRK